jgi:hypothetical protein
MKTMVGASALAVLGLILMALLVVGVSWTPAPVTCEPHGLRQMPCYQRMG